MTEITEFVFDTDDASGEYGVLPKKYVDTGFNYSWNPTILFHDIFEHMIESDHKYFKDNYAFNVGGEIFAMGILYYLYDNFHLSCRIPSGYYSAEDRIMQTCESDMIESIAYGYINYGNELLCNVPYQKPVDSYLEQRIIKQYEKLMSEEIRADDDDLENAIRYKKSITLGKLQRLYRYGYRTAAKRYPYSYHNSSVLHDYYKQCEKLCKIDLSELVEPKLTIKIKTGKELDYHIKLRSIYLNVDIKPFNYKIKEKYDYQG